MEDKSSDYFQRHSFQTGMQQTNKPKNNEMKHKTKHEC